jgi:2-polyprenyl-3-methyl-5-hydroxy-6-metoxy-1,4-benzoquinol methylase
MSGPAKADATPTVKDSHYYASVRPDVVAALPRPLGRVLDVGCGAGALASGLRGAGATQLVGIEVVPSVAQLALQELDQVLVGPVEHRVEELEGLFDTILCLDVLEHLVDPRDVLVRLRRHARQGAHLQVSVPNARHYSLVGDLVLRGTFGYTEWGHRDNTHLRWFTRRDIVRLVENAGWRVTGTSVPPLGKSAILHRITRGWSSEFVVAQVYLAAVNRP